jgi:hypothetical protein
MAREMQRILSAQHSTARPSCFDSQEQYQSYLYYKRVSADFGLHRGACQDCLPEFKTQMLDAGKCDHPETIFVTMVDASDEVSTVGVNSQSKWWKRVQGGQLVFRLRRDADGMETAEE